MSETSTNEAWEQIFYQLNLSEKIHDNGIAFITSKEIKKISNREPRLMCKWEC